MAKKKSAARVKRLKEKKAARIKAGKAKARARVRAAKAKAKERTRAKAQKAKVRARAQKAKVLAKQKAKAAKTRRRARRPRARKMLSIMSHARILQDTGRLKNSVTPESDDHSARIGSTLVYARTHQLGYPKRRIPARPYLGVSDDGMELVRRILVRHIEGGK